MTKPIVKQSKLVTIIIAICLLLSLTMTAMAATNSTDKDGLEVTISTDKDEYAADEQIKVTLSVKNTNEVDVEDVDLGTLIPDGYELADKSTAKNEVGKLAAGETATLETVLVQKTNSPDPGPVNPSPAPSKDDDKDKESDTNKDDGKKTDDNKSNGTIANTDGDNSSNGSNSANGNNSSNNNSNSSSSSRSSSNSTASSNTSSGSGSSSSNTANRSGSNSSGNSGSSSTGSSTTVRSVNTGDNSHLMLWVGVALSALFGIALVWWLKKNKDGSGKAMLSIVLAVSMLASAAIAIPITVHAENLVQSTCSISTEIEVDSEKKAIEGFVKYQVDKPSENQEFTLTVSRKHFVVDEAEQEIYFYLHTVESYDKIVVKDSSGNDISELFDDGLFSTSGDDIEKDGTYSARVWCDFSQSGTKVYSAYGYQSNEVIKISNEINIIISDPLSDDESENMDVVDEKLSELLTSDTYHELTRDEKANAVVKLLEELVAQERVLEGTIEWVPDTGFVEFEYVGGIDGGVMIDDRSSEVNGSSSQTTSSILQNNTLLSTSNFANSTANLDGKNLWQATIYYSFDEESRSARFPQYTPIINSWKECGVKTNLVDRATVRDLADIDMSSKIIVFSMHGSYYKKNPVLCVSESVTSDNKKEYQAYLKAKQIAAVTWNTGLTEYAICPDFFSSNYDDFAFDGKFIFSETCRFFGKDGNVNFNLATSFNWADSVVGFHNSVAASYARDMLHSYVVNLTQGQNVGESLASCKKELGEDDRNSPYKKAHPDEPYAYPVQIGLTSLYLTTAIKNQSFESDLSDWETIGDCRTVPMLGSLTPTEGEKMAILTTGIGSAESKYLAGTEGSVISQSFVIPSTANTLSFDYNVVSEEPMEYVGSSFDDTFEAYAIIGNGSEEYKSSLAKESINTSTWLEFSDVDFEGGDSTIYQIGWKDASLDVSNHRGEVITLYFTVYDVGDSAYDTAALIDNINIA